MKENAPIPYPKEGICSLRLPRQASKSVYEKILIGRYKLWIQYYALEIFEVSPPKKQKAAHTKKKNTMNVPMKMFTNFLQGFFIRPANRLSELKDLVKEKIFFDKTDLSQVITL